MRKLIFWSVFLVLVFAIKVESFAVPPAAPPQPSWGPGGASYNHAKIVTTRIGAYEDKYYIFEPDSPRPASAPVVVFIHGWTATKPEYYQGWIQHLCWRGNIVIFPCFQNSGEPVEHYFANVVRSVRDAFTVLVRGNHVEPDWNRVAFIGHECGGVLAANLAASAKYFKLPRPKALTIIMPSRSPGLNIASRLELWDLSKIQEGTLMHIWVGDHDKSNGDATAREIFLAADSLRVQDKNFITLVSDFHGIPALVADRYAPLSPVDPIVCREIDRRRWEYVRLFRDSFFAQKIRTQAIDSHDWLGFWRLFDALFYAAITGQGKKSVLGGSEEQRNLGYWSDGKPVNPLLVTERP